MTEQAPPTDGRYVAVIHSAFIWGSGESRGAVTIYGDQPIGEWRTNQGRKRGMLLADDIPTVLRDLADHYEREGGWDGIVEAMERAHEGRR